MPVAVITIKGNFRVGLNLNICWNGGLPPSFLLLGSEGCIWWHVEFGDLRRSGKRIFVSLHWNPQRLCNQFIHLAPFENVDLCMGPFLSSLAKPVRFFSFPILLWLHTFYIILTTIPSLPPVPSDFLLHLSRIEKGLLDHYHVSVKERTR